ncbi:MULTISPECIES: SUKH-3 domain-containing protein [Streptacidiphilus]|uniref:SUKH-3 domain-containing protein n=1 Tax=Streptacidiphilus cavernicola TaxID=3342716 RepID=A0ABV6USW3_9ACTN|nr:SUKH-3 domain-containing protein [Streptacidiphilus jeojiense]
MEEWNRVRGGLRFGQRLSGRVVRVPRPGAMGIFIDVGLPVGGFVDVLLLPVDADRWPREGSVVEFEVWWADERPQLRLKPVDPCFLRDDFDRWQARMRPAWAAERGQPVPVSTSSAATQARVHAWVDATATPLAEADVVTGFSIETEEALRAAGWWPSRRVSVDPWRDALEEDGLVHLHEAAERFLAEFGGLSVSLSGPGITCAKTPFEFDPELCVGEGDRFADWGETIGRDLFPIGELDQGRFFLGIDEHSEIYLVADWIATFGPLKDALEKLVLGVLPQTIATS